MYNDEWKSVMTADSMEEKIREFATLAQRRADEQDKDVEEVVHDLTHESYLLKHTTSDVIKELHDLEETYPNEFYDGAANEYLMKSVDRDVDFEFWSDYVSLFLAAGLEWAILTELNEPTTTH